MEDQTKAALVFDDLNDPRLPQNPTTTERLRADNNLDSEYLPGVEVIGAGYNIYGPYASTNSVTIQLFDWPDAPSQPVIFNPNYKAPKVVDVQQADAATYTNVSGSTINSFQENFSAKITVSGAYNLFSGSISNEFTSSNITKSENEFSRIQQSISKWSLRLSATSDLRQYLKATVKDQIDKAATEDDFERLFTLYGAHFLTGVIMGGSAVLSSSTDKLSVDRTYSNETVAKATYEGLTGQLSAEAKAKYSQSLSSFKDNSEMRNHVVGGDGVAASKVFSGDKKDFDAWKDTVGVSPDFVDFVPTLAVAGLWELAKDAEQRQAMQDYFDNIWGPQKSQEAQIYPDYIDAVTVIAGGKDEKPPQGYTRIDYDLNKGDVTTTYIYICYHKAQYKQKGSNKDCVTDFKVIKGDDPTPAGFTKINVDLNKGVPFSDYNYLCYKKAEYDPESSIEDLTVIGGDNPNLTPPYSFEKLDTDLNGGGGGQYIYLCYSRNA